MRFVVKLSLLFMHSCGMYFYKTYHLQFTTYMIFDNFKHIMYRKAIKYCHIDKLLIESYLNLKIIAHQNFEIIAGSPNFEYGKIIDRNSRGGYRI